MEHEAVGGLGSSLSKQKRWQWLPASPDDHYQWANSDVWNQWPPVGKLAPDLKPLGHTMWILGCAVSCSPRQLTVQRSIVN